MIILVSGHNNELKYIQILRDYERSQRLLIKIVNDTIVLLKLLNCRIRDRQRDCNQTFKPSALNTREFQAGINKLILQLEASMSISDLKSIILMH